VYDNIRIKRFCKKEANKREHPASFPGIGGKFGQIDKRFLMKRIEAQEW